MNIVYVTLYTLLIILKKKKCLQVIKKLKSIVPCTLKSITHGCVRQWHVLGEIENTVGIYGRAGYSVSLHILAGNGLRLDFGGKKCVKFRKDDGDWGNVVIKAGYMRIIVELEANCFTTFSKLSQIIFCVLLVCWQSWL